jgi:hypothetical protein
MVRLTDSHLHRMGRSFASIIPSAPTAFPADVPGADLCLNNRPGGNALRTSPSPGNPVPSRSKLVIRPGGRPPLVRVGWSLSSRPLPLTTLNGRRWRASAVQADAGQKAGDEGCAPNSSRFGHRQKDVPETSFTVFASNRLNSQTTSVRLDQKLVIECVNV